MFFDTFYSYVDEVSMTDVIDKDILYNGRWVSRKYFRAVVYNSTGEKLANSYQEFSDLIASGTWFAEKKDIPSEILLPQETNVVDIKPKRGRKCQIHKSK
jgi:hypothetical protein